MPVAKKSSACVGFVARSIGNLISLHTHLSVHFCVKRVLSAARCFSPPTDNPRREQMRSLAISPYVKRSYFQGITIKPLVKILNVKRAEKRKPTMNERIHERVRCTTIIISISVYCRCNSLPLLGNKAINRGTDIDMQKFDEIVIAALTITEPITSNPPPLSLPPLRYITL